MPLQRFRYRVWLDPEPATDPAFEPVEHDVEVRHGDLLRAELEAGQQNLPVDPRKVPQQTTALWVWAALVRTHLVTVDYRTFRDGIPPNMDPACPDGMRPVLVGIEQLRDPATGEAVTVDVPPTSPQGASPSPSQSTSATSPGGSTPTPMSG